MAGEETPGAEVARVSAYNEDTVDEVLKECAGVPIQKLNGFNLATKAMASNLATFTANLEKEIESGDTEIKEGSCHVALCMPPKVGSTHSEKSRSVKVNLARAILSSNGGPQHYHTAQITGVTITDCANTSDTPLLLVDNGRTFTAGASIGLPVERVGEAPSTGLAVIPPYGAAAHGSATKQLGLNIAHPDIVRKYRGLDFSKVQAGETPLDSNTMTYVSQYGKTGVDPFLVFSILNLKHVQHKITASWLSPSSENQGRGAVALHFNMGDYKRLTGLMRSTVTEPLSKTIVHLAEESGSKDGPELNFCFQPVTGVSTASGHDFEGEHSAYCGLKVDYILRS